MSTKIQPVAHPAPTAQDDLSAALEQIRERFHFLAEFSSDWYWEQDDQFRFTYFARNEGSESSFPAQQSLGKTRWEIPYEGITPAFWDEHRRMLEARQPFHDLVLKRRNAAGELRYTSISGAPVFDKAGRFIGYRGIGRDVTSRIAAVQRQSVEHQITRILSESNSIDTTIPAILETICTTLGWDYGAYSVLDRRHDALARMHFWHGGTGDISEFLNASVTFRLGYDPDTRADQAPGLVCRAWLTQQPVWVDDIGRNPCFTRSATALKAGFHAAFALPVLSGKTVSGVMEFFHSETCKSDPLLIDTLVSIGRQVAAFLDRKQLEARQSMQNIVTRLLAESGSLNEAMPRIIQTMCQTLGWNYGAWWRMDDSAASLQCESVWSNEHAHVQPFVDWAAGRSISIDRGRLLQSDSFMRQLWHEGEPVWLADLAREYPSRGSVQGRSQLAVGCGLHSLFCFPILAGQKLLGLVEFFSDHIRQPDDALIETAKAIGIQIGLFCQRKEAEEQIQFLAYHDSLTGLPNRALFTLRLEHALQRARRYGHQVALLFMDMDRFKVINDTLGHDVGDKLLQEMAGRFSCCLRESDVLARLGGDEFVVLLENGPSHETAATVAEKLIHAARQPFLTEVGECQLTTSIGISLYPENGDDEQTLLRHADIAMYQAKGLGKNTYQFYFDGLNSHSLKRLSLESRLRKALENKELSLRYQPRVALADQRIIGMEALIRWHCPGIGAVSPAEFIPIAEETGMIGEIGYWVLHTACAQSKEWLSQGMPPLTVSVNLSARQFNDRQLTEQLAAILDRTGFPARHLELEITESMVMHDPEEAIRTLHAIRAMGVSIAMDDFGTGYSSLGQLMRFPINTIKIDRSFISDVANTREHAAITAATIALSKALALNVVAEGVETREQVDFLHAHACQEAQGYYFSQPLTPEDFQQLACFGWQPVCQETDSYP